MAEVLEILNSQHGNTGIKIGNQMTGLLQRESKLTNEERATLQDETVKILSNCSSPDSTSGGATGIVIGYVQSGKTMSFTALTALAADNGYRIIIYFAGIKNNLLEQTTKRLKKDLLIESVNRRFFKVYQSPTMQDDAESSIKGALGQSQKPVILITVLKHYKHIDELTRIFQTSEVKSALGTGGVIIIDDEADQASLNTYAKKNSKAEDWEDDEFSSTYTSIMDLRNAIPNHTYLQYTATPQAPLLINIMDLLSPKFHILLTPGSAYTGGKTFFKENLGLVLNIPQNEVYHFKRNNLEDCPQSLIDALQIFLMGVAVTVYIQQKEYFLSMMIHADREQDASRKFHQWVKTILSNWQDRLNQLPENDPSRAELTREFKNLYPEAVKLIPEPPSFKLVMENVAEAIQDYNIELIISKNGKKNNEINWSNASAHILIGAEMLNRGYTVEGLAVSYMPRYTIGKTNADTIQQRCRFFGYKRNYLESCRVFLPQGSIDEYEDYVEHEEIMRRELKDKTLEEFEQVFILGPGMNPTRGNILTKDIVRSKLSGWRQFNALQHIDDNFQFINNFISTHNFTPFTDFNTPDRNHRYIKLPIEEVIRFLKDFKIANVPDTLRKSSTIQYLKHLAETTDLKDAYIFEMAYHVTTGRERSMVNEGSKLKINNIFSGRSTTNSVYPGDKEIMFRDFLCIQIHRIKLKDESSWNNQLIYTLGIYYPENLAHNFVGNPAI